MPEEAAWRKPRENWNPELVWVLQSFLANQAKWNTRQAVWFKYWSPRFYVAMGGEILATSTGVNGWNYDIAPLLAKLTGVKAT